MPSQLDKYPNILFHEVEESTVNTLEFDEIVIGLNIFDKVGLLIHRIEWYKFHPKLVADGDVIEFGLSASNGWATVDASEKSIITYHDARMKDLGTPATAIQEVYPLVDDFTQLPGGGILIAPKPLYMFVKGAALASVGKAQCRLFFTIIKMQPSDYFELLESRAFFG